MVSGARARLANADQCGPEGVQRGGVSIEGSSKPIERPPLTGALIAERFIEIPALVAEALTPGGP